MGKFKINNEICLISHQCHDRVNALKFKRLRRWYTEALRTTARKNKVPIIDYLIADNAIFILCQTKNPARLSAMMQVLQSASSKNFAHKRGGESSMWKGRFGITMIQRGVWASQCMLMLDLSMVASGRVTHPVEWEHSGWTEITKEKQRYRIIKPESIAEACYTYSEIGYIQYRNDYINKMEACLTDKSYGYLELWAESLAVGSEDWIEFVANILPSSYRTIEILPESIVPMSMAQRIYILKAPKKKRRSRVDYIFDSGKRRN